MKIMLSLIYAYYNTPKEILDSILSFEKIYKKKNYEIIIINNNSPKPLPDALNNKDKLTIINNQNNYGFGKAVNQGVKVSNGEYLLIINPDTLFLPNSIDLMINKIGTDKKIGILGPQLINVEGKVLHSIASMPTLPDALFALSFINKLWPNNPYSKRYWAIGINRNIERESETVGGAAMIIRKKIFKKVGGFDERFFLYFEEADLCRRIKKEGYKIVYYPRAKIIHLVGKSTTDKNFIKHHYEKSRFYFFKKYYGTIPALLAETFLRAPSYLKEQK